MGIVYLNYLMEENVDGLPVLGLLVHGLLAQPQQARARQRQELLHRSSLLFSGADPDPWWIKKQYPDPGSGSGMNIPDHIS
jgi:hypothetical protein